MSNNLNLRKVLHLRSSFLRFSILTGIVLLSNIAFSQSIPILILDEHEEPYVGAQVFSANTLLSTTDEDGQCYIPDQSKLFPINIYAFSYEELAISYDDFMAKTGNTIRLIPKAAVLENVTVVGRTNTSSDKIPYHIERIQKEEIQRKQSQTSADALTKNANVYIQKSQMGGGSPIVRGFEANKLLLVVDGVRLNNAIYRNGHLQNAITIDPSMLDQIEVLYGPGSLNYGSDALGGVIHFRSTDPSLSVGEFQKSLTANSTLRWSSANQEQHAHVDVNYGSNRWASLSSLSFSKFGDLRSGARQNDQFPDFGLRLDYIDTQDGLDEIVQNPDPYVQIGTAYEQLDLLQKFKFQIDQNSNLVVNLQYSNSSDIPRYDRLIERSDDQTLKFAEWYYGPQRRIMASARYTLDLDHTLFDRMIIIPAYQNVKEIRVDRRFQSTSRSTQDETLDIGSLTIDFNKNSLGLDWSYGFDLQHNSLESEAYSEDIITKEIQNDELSRYPDGKNSMLYSGIYLKAERDFWNKHINIQTGLRYSFNQINAQYIRRDLITWPESYYQGLDTNNSALTWSVGIRYQNDAIRLQLIGASAFRSPNIDDMAKIRIKAGDITIPNLDLSPERSNNIEVNYQQKIRTSTSLRASIFYTRLQDAIIRTAFALPDGTGQIIDGGDTLTTVANVNASSGYIYGYSVGANHAFNEKWALSAGYNYTYGRAQKDNEAETPLAHIPPAYGNINLSYESRLCDLSADYRFNASKAAADFDPSVDNLDLATAIGSLSWSTFNVYSEFRIGELSLGLAMENIFDVHYRPFASGISAPGRNVIVSLRSKL